MTGGRLRAKRADERGSATVFFLITTAAIIAALGLAADVGASLAASAQVTDEAEQAARIAAEQLNPQDLRAGRINIDRVAATAAAETYLRSFGDTGTVTIHGQRVVVTAHRPVLTQFLDALDVPGLTAKGTGAATTIPGINAPHDVPAVIASHNTARQKAQP